MVLDNTNWSASAIAGEPAAGAEITAGFDDQTMSGSAGCNRYSGSYEIDGTALTFTSPVVTTLMACDEAIMTQERRFLQALDSVETFTVEGSTLTLRDSSGRVVVSFDEVSQELAGSSWTIISYRDGDGVVSLLEGTEATLAFTHGDLEASTGCNIVSAQYSSADGSLTTSEVMQTEMYCEEPDGVMDQESAIAQAIGRASTYRIDGKTLTIWAADESILLILERS